jgi:hypothetical protein
MDIIKQIYRDPSTGLTNANDLYKKVKEIDKTITLKQVKDYFKKSYSSQINKPVIKPKTYMPITSNFENELLQIDLMNVDELSTRNKNFKWIFVCVDVFTRKAYVEPMKNKSTISIIEAFTKILNKVKPISIMCDNGSEFISSQFKKLCKDNNILINYVDTNNHLIPHAGNRLGIVDRFIQTLRHKLQLYFDEYDTNTYINVLQQLVENINNTYNSGIKGIPNKPDELKLLMLMKDKQEKAIKEKEKFNCSVNDNVRCIVNKELFQKGAIPKWSHKIYTIKEIKGNSYLLDNGKLYKYYQIMKVDLTDNDERKRIEERQEIKKQRTIKRRLNKESIDLDNIIKRKRKRKTTDRLHY